MSQKTTHRLFAYEGYRLTHRKGSDKLYIQWYDARTARTRRKSTGTESLEIARDRLIAFVQTEKRKRSPDYKPEPHEVPIWEVLSYYLERKIRLEGHCEGQVRVAYKFFDLFFQEFQVNYVSDLNWEVMEEYPAFRNEASRKVKAKRWQSYAKYAHLPLETIEAQIPDLSPTTYRRDLGILTAALNLSKDHQRIATVPKIPKPKHFERRERWLRPEEFEALYAAADTQRLKDFIILAIYTLQRPGFCFSLHRSQVDINSRLIYPYKRGERETAKGRNPIRIPVSAVGPLQKMMERSQSGYLIEYEGQPIQTDLRKALMLAAERAGLHDDNTPSLEKVVPYTLRHTGATWLAQQGVDLWEIAGMLGHKSITMVQRVYAKHHPDYHQKGVAALDKIAGTVIERASFVPEGDFDALKADFLIPFNPMVSVDLRGGAAERNRTSDLTLTKESVSFNYKDLSYLQSYYITLDSLAFSSVTCQLRASDTSEPELKLFL